MKRGIRTTSISLLITVTALAWNTDRTNQPREVQIRMEVEDVGAVLFFCKRCLDGESGRNLSDADRALVFKNSHHIDLIEEIAELNTFLREGAIPEEYAVLPKMLQQALQNDEEFDAAHNIKRDESRDIDYWRARYSFIVKELAGFKEFDYEMIRKRTEPLAPTNALPSTPGAESLVNAPEGLELSDADRAYFEREFRVDELIGAIHFLRTNNIDIAERYIQLGRNDNDIMHLIKVRHMTLVSKLTELRDLLGDIPNEARSRQRVALRTAVTSVMEADARFDEENGYAEKADSLRDWEYWNHRLQTAFENAQLIEQPDPGIRREVKEPPGAGAEYAPTCSLDQPVRRPVCSRWPGR